MLTGQRAFQKATSIDAMSAILNEEPPSLLQVKPEPAAGLERVLHRGLEKNPEQRFQSASDLGFALEAFSDAGHSTFTSGYRMEEEPRAKSHVPVSLGVIGGVVILGLVGAWMWMRPVPAPQVANYVQLTHERG